MPYIIEVVKAGNTIEVSKHYSSRFNKKGVKRGKRKQLTTDEQREVNKRAAEKKLRRLINENFQEGDTHLVLDYKLSERPAGRKAMRADADDFLQEMRRSIRIQIRTIPPHLLLYHAPGAFFQIRLGFLRPLLRSLQFFRKPVRLFFIRRNQPRNLL